MRRSVALLLFAVVFQPLAAEDTLADFKAKQPILITTVGQSADILMVKILSQKAGLQFTMDKLARPDSLANQSALIIVSGGSTKGLGAAKINPEDELARVQTLVDTARAAGIKIITMHMGGKARRGKMSDRFNQLAAENADCMIVVKSGDEDQFFSNIAAEKKIPIFLVEKIINAQEVLESIFK
ncbi:MAG: hypothetical protein KAU50_07690 [Candidatus Marinimicrobia bacterium]|nr:hypothetical protein [Candidatus Neomarinimicrobiota bacterium]